MQVALFATVVHFPTMGGFAEVSVGVSLQSKELPVEAQQFSPPYLSSSFTTSHTCPISVHQPIDCVKGEYGIRVFLIVIETANKLILNGPVLPT